MTNIVSFDSIDICQSVQIVAYLGSWITKRKRTMSENSQIKDSFYSILRTLKSLKNINPVKKMDDKNKDNK